MSLNDNDIRLADEMARMYSNRYIRRQREVIPKIPEADIRNAAQRIYNEQFDRYKTSILGNNAIADERERQYRELERQSELQRELQRQQEQERIERRQFRELEYNRAIRARQPPRGFFANMFNRTNSILPYVEPYVDEGDTERESTDENS